MVDQLLTFFSSLRRLFTFIAKSSPRSLPTPRPSNKTTSQLENKDDSDAKVESKDKLEVTSPDASTSEKEAAESKIKTES